ncbi:hypothetical protein A2T76_04330 [Pseudomonas brenneri]|nr:hypothetical protein A2T76_04330 [Pseudomonas brenneri]
MPWGHVYCLISKRKIEDGKAQLCAKVENPFPVIKVRFNQRKVRYRGLKRIQRKVVQSIWVGQFAAGQTVFATGDGIKPPESEMSPRISKMRAEIALRNPE